MPATIIRKSFEDIHSGGLFSPQERMTILVDAGFRIDAELKRGPARDADASSDDFVNWNFRRTWRRGKVPAKAIFGTDYDYFTMVARQAKVLWERWTSGLDPDPDRSFGGVRFGASPMPYTDSLGIWQNGVEVTFNTPLKGPQIDIGPKVDYGLFLERWIIRKSEPPYVNVLQRIGVLHAIAARLNTDWKGVHHVYVVASGTGADSAPREDRKEPIDRFPLIRIQTRHR